MKPNDETIYGGMPVENEENPQVVNEKEGKKEVPWKFIGLGAATGILMGAGALYATDAMAAGTTEPTDEQPAEDANAAETAKTAEAPSMPVAKNVPTDSFEHAFAEARAQVGPGGLFEWHGGIYNTYTKEEWDALNEDDKLAFASNVHPQYPVHRIETIHITEKEPDIHIDKLEIHEHNYVLNETKEQPQEQPQEPKDDDVHVVTYVSTDNVKVNDTEFSVDNYVVDGHNAAVVNFHDDGKNDIVIVDKNDNLKIDDGEAMDTVTEQLLDADLNPLHDPNLGNLMADSSTPDAAPDVTNI